MKSNYESDKLIVFDNKRFAIQDGPGIRTTIFLKGCPLNCGWCHNPEAIESGCGLIGKKIKLGDLFKEIIKDKHFYQISNGGITFSGGEPLLQIKPLVKLLEKCKKFGINTAVDTSGYCEWKSLEKIVPFVDLFIYDLKHVDNIAHEKGTGVGNELILENLRRLNEKKCNIIVRIPLISGFNDDEKTFEDIGEFLSKLKNIKAVEILPFNKFTEAKYSSIGKHVDKKYIKILSQKKINELSRILKRNLKI